ncbi:MAG TPA: peptidoglycan-binding protein [Tepidisphaeraceae bacterium]|jgi:outer membrane protein OmpA-like peptidoglycan-associated protein
MSAAVGGTIHFVTAGAIAASHPARPAAAIPVAPTSDTRSNLLRSAIFPIACWRVEELLFDFGSSFVHPDGQPELRALRDLRERHKKESGGKVLAPPLSVFGHADPVGSDDYNKKLSGRRATAIYALLVRDTARWETLFSDPLGDDKWGTPAVQTMLAALGALKGPPSGKADAATRDAVKSFQSANGLAVDGDPGPATRKALFKAYMDFLCGPDFVLDKHEDFLGRGADAEGKGDLQGCGEFNPVLMFSRAEQAALAGPANKEDRDAENAPNRRVVVFLFRPGARVTSGFWPCPRVSEGVAGCKKRFWSDADSRRQFKENHRAFPKDRDTFACRFYDRMANRSPCETVSPVLIIRLYDPSGEFMPRTPFRLTIDGQPARNGFADAKGVVTVRSVPPPGRCVIEWGAATPGTTSSDAAAAAGADAAPPAADAAGNESAQAGAAAAAATGANGFPFHRQVIFDLAGDEQAAAERRLHNLGYDLAGSLPNNVSAFQTDYGDQFGLSQTGALDPQTQDAIRQVHDNVRDNIRLNKDGGGAAG